MNFTLHQLQVFAKIARESSVTRAAEALHLTQPAVSIQLRNFQEQFDIPLTEVIGRRIHLTDFGREIAETAEKILNEVYAINYKTLAHKGLLTGKLTVAVVSTGKYVMPYFMSQFIRENPGIDLVMDVTNRVGVLRSLADNEVDFALVSILPPALEVNAIPLMPNKLFLVGKEPIPGSPEIQKPDILEELPLIYREKGSGTRVSMEDFIATHDLKVGMRMELSSNEAVKQAILAGLGYSIMPLIGIRNELARNELQIIPVEQLPITTCWNLVSLKNKKFSPVAAAYLRFLEENKSAVIRDSFGWADMY